MTYERQGKSDEWYTPKYIFDAIGLSYEMDVAGDLNNPNQSVPARRALSCDGLNQPWEGRIWMNPPFGGRNALWPWVKKFLLHGRGIALVPDRTSAPWWQFLASHSDVICFVSPKVKFIDANGELGRSPSNGITLHAVGKEEAFALLNCGLGVALLGESGEMS